MSEENINKEDDLMSHFEGMEPEPEKKEEEVREIKLGNPTEVFSSEGQSNAKLEKEYSKESGDKETDRFIPLPSLPLDQFTKRIESLEDVLKDLSDTFKDWGETMGAAVDLYTPRALYQERFSDPSSEFLQGIRGEDGSLSSISPLKFRDSSGELKGEMAILKVSRFLGLGEVKSIPLPHSGIWVSIKPPTERELIDFYNMYFREKQRLGRNTHGFSLTNMSVHVNSRLYNLIIRHITSVNYKDIGIDKLKDKILIHDLPILIWGLASSIHPTGFEYQRSCINDPNVCSTIIREKLALDELLWIDNKSLSPFQLKTLQENRPKTLTEDTYNKYISEHSRVSGSTFTTSNGIKFKFKVPSVGQYFDEGLRWVNSITNHVDTIVTDESDDSDGKLEALNNYVMASYLKQYGHFVDYVEVGDNVFTDRDTIEELLTVFSAQDTVREEFVDAVTRYMSNTNIGLVGIPEYNCKGCGTNQNGGEVKSKVTNVIPLDTLQLCFLMLTSRISQILEREV